MSATPTPQTETIDAAATARADRLVAVQLRMALACIVIAVLGGVVGALHYIPSLSPALHEAGFGLTKLRPLHTTFATLWIYGGAIAVIYHYLGNLGPGLSTGDARRFWLHTACWITAGIGVIVTLALDIYSGREYLGFHPAVSAVLLFGWLLFAYNFLRRACRDFWRQPVYIYFWTVGILYFVYTFVEGHAYLLPFVQEQPVYDIALHWKACGTLVGSFNFLVYGALVYVSEKLSGDKRYGQSSLAFALFGVGCLNSFTNFAHHTYHLPQDELVKWIAFIVSMTEIVILARLLFDVANMVRKRSGEKPCYNAAAGYLVSAKWWTTVMLTLSILISVPSFNSLMHGTHMVTGHAMGTELGIDTMVLFGAVSFLLCEIYSHAPRAVSHVDAPHMRAHTALLNVAMAVLVGWLSLSGLVHGIYRYYQEPSPDWIGWGTYLFPVTGSVLAICLLYLVWRWAPMLLPSAGAAPAGRTDTSGEPAI